MARFTTNDDVNLSYTDDGTGQPVVLIHGYTAPASSWALTSDALLNAGYRVVAFDRRCTGDASRLYFAEALRCAEPILPELVQDVDVGLPSAANGVRPQRLPEVLSPGAPGDQHFGVRRHTAMNTPNRGERPPLNAVSCSPTGCRRRQAGSTTCLTSGRSCVAVLGNRLDHRV
jgi:pimeloyl-ACP methyl ester carboxylesterase